MVHLNISNHAIITVKNVNHLCIFISLSESINLLKNSVIDERGYILNAYQLLRIKSILTN